MSSNKVQIRNCTNDFLIFNKENGGDGLITLCKKVELGRISNFIKTQNHYHFARIIITSQCSSKNPHKQMVE